MKEFKSLNFNVALVAMHLGHSVRRASWEETYGGKFFLRIYELGFVLHGPDGFERMEHLSSKDILAEDWELLLEDDA